MSGYTRTTRDCPVSQLHPGLSQAIREYFQTHLLGDAETETRLCCETISEKRRTQAGWPPFWKGRATRPPISPS